MLNGTEVAAIVLCRLTLGNQKNSVEFRAMNEDHQVSLQGKRADESNNGALW